MSLDITRVEGYVVGWVGAKGPEEVVDALRGGEVDVLGINPLRGYPYADISFLRRYPELRSVHIVFGFGSRFDLAPLYSVKGLRRLYLSESVPVDLSGFSELEEFNGQWPGVRHLESCAQLRRLVLRGYPDSDVDLNGLPALPLLQSLDLVASRLRSLAGIERLGGVRELSVAMMRSLADISALEGLRGLEVLKLEGCRKIRDYTPVYRCHGLRVLFLNGCAPIPSLAGLDGLSRLEEFRFVGTDVIDGDLRPLLRVARVGFQRKKHFSHTPEELEKEKQAALSRHE